MRSYAYWGQTAEGAHVLLSHASASSPTLALRGLELLVCAQAYLRKLRSVRRYLYDHARARYDEVEPGRLSVALCGEGAPS